MSTERWMEKEDAVYINKMEYDLAIKKNKILPLVLTMDGLEVYYAMWNKSERNKLHMISLICVI